MAFADIDFTTTVLPSGGWASGWSYQTPAPIYGDRLWTEAIATRVCSQNDKIVLTTDAITAKIEALKSLAFGWDGMNGKPPSAETIRLAKSLYELVPEGISRPQVTFAGDGEINLVWKDRNSYFEIGADPGGTVSFYGKSAPSNEPIYGDISELTESLPDTALEFLSRFADDGVRVRKRATKPV